MSSPRDAYEPDEGKAMVRVFLRMSPAAAMAILSEGFRGIEEVYLSLERPIAPRRARLLVPDDPDDDADDETVVLALRLPAAVFTDYEFADWNDETLRDLRVCVVPGDILRSRV